MTKLERASSPELDAILGDTFPVLDKGFIRVIDYMGNDAAITQAARVSYGTGTKKVNEDKGLIRYLLRHSHTTPFEMCEIKLHVKLPVFVARQWIRHRMANVNEYSARYSILDNEFYFPESDQIKAQSKSNKQGRDGELPDNVAEIFRAELMNFCGNSYAAYRDYTSEEKDVSRELARMMLPANIYTQWYWKTDLHNLLHFLRLRADSHAQWEIRQYANVICDIVKEWVPAAWGAFEDYKMNAITLSAMEVEAIKKYISAQSDMGGHPSDYLDGVSKRELDEFKLKF